MRALGAPGNIKAADAAGERSAPSARVYVHLESAESIECRGELQRPKSRQSAGASLVQSVETLTLNDTRNQVRNLTQRPLPVMKRSRANTNARPTDRVCARETSCDAADRSITCLPNTSVSRSRTLRSTSRRPLLGSTERGTGARRGIASILPAVSGWRPVGKSPATRRASSVTSWGRNSFMAKTVSATSR